MTKAERDAIDTKRDVERILEYNASIGRPRYVTNQTALMLLGSVLANEAHKRDTV